LGAAALEREFGIDLFPAISLIADKLLFAKLDVVEKHFGEMRIAGQVGDGTDSDAWRGEIDDELGQTLVAILRCAGRAYQGDHVMRTMRVGRPDLAAVEQPSLVGSCGSRAHAGQIRPGTRFAHADAEERLAAADAGNVELALGFRAVVEDER